MLEATTHTLATFVWLSLLASTAILYFVRQVRNSDYGLWESCLYAPTFLMGRLLWRVQFLNAAPAEIASGAVLVANHRSSIDPFLVQLAARRRVHWMVAKEYCDHFLFGLVLRPLLVIPTNRSGMDTASTKLAIQFTKEDRLVGMFPEGRINRSSDLLLPLRGGAALVAARAGVPMIPLFIEGSPFRDQIWSPLFMPAHVRITFGSPIFPEKRSDESTIRGESRSNAQRSEYRGAAVARSQELSDLMMLDWGEQIIQLANVSSFEVMLASARKKSSRKHPQDAPRQPGVNQLT